MKTSDSVPSVRVPFFIAGKPPSAGHKKKPPGERSPGGFLQFSTARSATRSLERRVHVRAREALGLRDRHASHDDVRRVIDRQRAQTIEATDVDPAVTFERQREAAIVEQLVDEVRIARE